jgi:Kef-type K+ transport system membrane component KefB
MDVILQIFLVVLLAKVFGELSIRLGLPSILGGILAGIVIGPFFAEPNGEIFSFLAELGAIFLFFTAAYNEVSIRYIQTLSKYTLVPTFTHILVAFVCGYTLGHIFNLGFLENIFIGIAFSSTSIGSVVNMLIGCNYLSKNPGPILLSSAILNNFVGVIMLGIIVSAATYQRLPGGREILTIISGVVGFLVIMIVLGYKVYPILFKYIHRMQIKESIFAFVIIIALISAYLAEILGLHSVIGAFIGGIFLSEIPLARIEDIQSKVSGISYGVFIPMFYAFIGMSIDFSILQTNGLFTIAVIVLALLGKLLGGYIGSRILKVNSYDSLIFGIGSMPKADVELVVISIGLSMGVIGDVSYSAIVLMVATSVVVSPLLLKYTIQAKEGANIGCRGL